MLARAALLLALAAIHIALSLSQCENLVEAARGLFELSKFEDAEALLREVLLESPSDPSALVLLGRARATAGGHVDEAKGLYRRALEASPDHAPAHHALAKVFAFQHRWQEAKDSFEKSLRLNPENAEAWLGMARVTMAMGDDDAAEEHYQRSLDLDPTNALLHFDLGVLACRKGRAHAAEEAFLKAAELNPNLDFAVVAQMFMAHEMLDRARDAYKRVLHKNPENSEHLLAYGELCEALGDVDEAMKAYDKALDRTPRMGKAHLRKALLLMGAGINNLGAVRACGLNAEEAKRHLRAALGEDGRGARGVGAQASEALAWCQMEEQQVLQWRRILGELHDHSAPESDPGSRSEQSAERPAREYEECDDSRSRRRPLPHQEAPKQGQDRSHGQGLVLGPTAVEAESTRAPRWVEEAGGFLAVAEVEGVPAGREFAEAFVNQSRPVVIKTLQSGFAAKEAWSWERLSARFGQRTVRISVSEDGRFDGPEPGELWGLPHGEEVLVRPPSTWTAFSDFVRLLRTEDIAETFYLEYLAVHQYLGGLLQEMIQLPDAVSESGLELLLVNLWASKGGTTAVLHYDDYENILCQIRGTKELLLFPPKDLENLYYVGRRKGKLEYEFPGRWRRHVSLEGPNKVVFSSSVRVEKPDFKKHPRLRRCRPYRVVLQEGDSLYIPAFWHHEASVRSYPDVDGGNVAVNFWFRNVTSFAEEQEVLGLLGDPRSAEL
ncbi:unnamed protein product [Ascophyllum nodosum]